MDNIYNIQVIYNFTSMTEKYTMQISGTSIWCILVSSYQTIYVKKILIDDYHIF